MADPTNTQQAIKHLTAEIKVRTERGFDPAEDPVLKRKNKTLQALQARATTIQEEVETKFTNSDANAADPAGVLIDPAASAEPTAVVSENLQ